MTKKSSTTKTKAKAKKKSDLDMARSVANVLGFIDSFTLDGDDDENDDDWSDED